MVHRQHRTYFDFGQWRACHGVQGAVFGTETLRENNLEAIKLGLIKVDFEPKLTA